MRDAYGKLGDFGDEAFERAGQGTGDLTLGAGLGVPDQARRGSAQADEQLSWRSTPATGVLGEEAGQALLAQPVGAARGRVAADEGECDRAVDGGEDSSGAGPETFEQGATLVGERDPLGDQVVAPSDQGPRRLDVVRSWHKASEGVAVGAQDVREHKGFARVAFAARGAIARSACFDHVGVDRHDRISGLHQGIDDHARPTLASARRSARAGPAGQPVRRRHAEP
jgi:hypothetical protein